MQTLTALKAKKYVVSIQTPEGHYKVDQIVCANDGSLFVTLPYYKNSNGTVTHAKLHRNLPYPQSLDLGICGNVTSHLVKYSHHTDGRVHFSQDGKVLTSIKTQSIELNKANGHIFTIQLQGLKDFTNIVSKDQKPDKKKFLLEYCFKKKEPEAIKILGFWHPFSILKKMLQESENNPIHEFNLPNDRRRFGYTLSVGGNNFEEYQYLLLQCEEVPKLTEDTKSFLLFLGGFDPPKIAYDHTKDTSFLILAYPLIGNFDEITKRIGSIDLITTRGQQ